ncbi:hypothetical protein ACLZRP_26550 [Klebsiella pneumoniae]|nr:MULTISPECIES: hypothetical protein [Klebsiella]HBW8924306.1 hypothetical protein [Klebsiella pneumoniae subsp. pneumoniae 1158]HDU5605115.1 hypothetical protein [Klebsiella pneumoniae subsp. ozaenae]EIW3898137.1 hypothetical protein [Klebsiella pneumoniae]MBR9935466.1 hypothetical protein [Klebsiella pneumoniae]MBS9457861.1 hypothetical protein [Klebsiella pneumoniae]
MRRLTAEECNCIYGGGVGLGEALETIIDGIVEATHASEGALSLAEALGAFDGKKDFTVPKYTTDKDVLQMDVDVANSYMHELQTHTGSDKVSDSAREACINELQNDGRVYYNPLEHKFDILGGAPESGAVTQRDLKDPDIRNFYNYIMEQDVKNINSSDPTTAKNALESIQYSTREGVYHYSVTQGKFVLG